MRYADVIVPLAVEGMYTYTVPVSLESEVREGTLVLVSFAGNKRYTALVGRIHDQAPVGYQVKPIEDVVEKQVSFSALHLRFLLWLGGYYMATPGEVMMRLYRWLSVWRVLPVLPVRRRKWIMRG